MAVTDDGEVFSWGLGTEGQVLLLVMGLAHAPGAARDGFGASSSCCQFTHYHCSVGAFHCFSLATETRRLSPFQSKSWLFKAPKWWMSNVVKVTVSSSLPRVSCWRLGVVATASWDELTVWKVKPQRVQALDKSMCVVATLLFFFSFVSRVCCCVVPLLSWL